MPAPRAHTATTRPTHTLLSRRRNPPISDPIRNDADAAILAALAAVTGVTDARSIAAHAGLGYSTATRKLRDLAEQGLVVGDTTDGGPAQWRLPTPTTTRTDSPPTEPGRDDAALTEPAGEPPATLPADDSAPSQMAPAGTTPDSAVPPTPFDQPPATKPADSPGETAAAAATDAADSACAPAGTCEGTTAARRRPGQLHSQVVAFLQNHPDTYYRVAELSKLLGASGGAIANALTALVGQGSVVQTLEHPATYKAL